MKKYLSIAMCLLVGQTMFASETPTAKEVLSLAEKVAEYNIKNPRDNISLRHWPIAPYYDGLIALSRATGNARYWAEVVRFGDAVAWTYCEGRPYHADDFAVPHAWLETYRADTSKKERFIYVKQGLDKIIADASTWATGESKGFGRSPVCSWNWCDALYMAPITFLHMYHITNDKKYLDYLNKEFKWSTDTLFSKEDGLFYRDRRFIGQLTENNKKVFWGRGNGWVIAGLAMVLKEYPKDNPNYKFYKDLYLQMAKAVKEAQLENGLWGVNLADNKQFNKGITKGGEGSSSGFITFALAWGVNEGLLDESYWNTVLKAWEGLKSLIDENGKVCYVQPIGASPNAFNKNTTQVYGVGAFLMSASEIAKKLGNVERISDKQLVEQAEKFNESRNEMANVRYEPRRKMDVAWENTEVAHRVYGPELEKSIENSGIDVFSKTVKYNVAKKWYDEWKRTGWSYHTDKGEGCDLFKVADTVGCGGTAIYHKGKIYKSNVYKQCNVILAPEGSAKLGFIYHYDVDGRKITEIKLLSIGTTGNATKSHSYFVKGHKMFGDWCNGFEHLLAKIDKHAVKNITVVAGIYTQSKDAKITTKENGEIFVSDIQEKKVPIDMFLKVSPNTKVKGFKTIEGKGGRKEVLVLMKPSKTGEVEHNFGYTLKK